MRKISECISVNITSDQHRRLQRIDNEDFSLVIYKVIEELDIDNSSTLTGGYVENGIFALKQYYAIAMLDPANAHSVSSTLDPFWHAHILCTGAYREFCNEVIGEYMDHVPLDRRDSDKVANVRQLYNYTQSILPKVFSTVSDVFWPRSVLDSDLICYHKGNSEIYLDVQNDRLFEPSQEGLVWAYDTKN